mmetsp:Transcript_69885/g.158595  ORF Transcript_69885/g.158595 Transcript_69885/m.158595 type:complete len:203 (-) Transcript_69885:387-995(-)
MKSSFGTHSLGMMSLLYTTVVKIFFISSLEAMDFDTMPGVAKPTPFTEAKPKHLGLCSVAVSSSNVTTAAAPAPREWPLTIKSYFGWLTAALIIFSWTSLRSHSADCSIPWCTVPPRKSAYSTASAAVLVNASSMVSVPRMQMTARLFSWSRRQACAGHRVSPCMQAWTTCFSSRPSICSMALAFAQSSSLVNAQPPVVASI